MITAYLGRDNTTRLSLQELHGDDELVIQPDTITRVVCTLVPRNGKTMFGMDTAGVDPTVVLVDAATAIDAQFGLIPKIIQGDYNVYFTVFDGGNPNGIAWGARIDRQGRFMTEPSLLLRMTRWPVYA